MKYMRYILSILLLTTLALKSSVNFRIGGFVPRTRLFEEIYGSVLPTYQIEVGFNLPKCFRFWSNLSYITSSGESHPLRFKTRLHMIPISAGAQYVFSFSNCVDFCIGAGLAGTWVKENKCKNFKQTAHNVGGIIKSQAVYHNGNLDFLFFADYLFLNVRNKNRRKINAGGFLFGAGIGINY